jgi:DNA-binding GntR family transcriptional regulator
MGRRTVAAPLREEVAKEVKADLATMSLMPGMRLTEKELCERYSVSRTIIREVLRELETAGLVRNIPNIGPVVAVLTPDEASQIYEIRGILVGLAARKFCEVASRSEIDQTIRIYRRIQKYAETNDVNSVLDAIAELHDTILDVIENEPLRGMLDRIHTRVAMLRVVTLSSKGRLPDTIKELKPVFDAFEARDANAAETAYIAHIDQVAQIARRELIKQQQENPAPRPMKRQSHSQ